MTFYYSDTVMYLFGLENGITNAGKRQDDFPDSVQDFVIFPDSAQLTRQT
jgi:hypothetical protein